MNITPKIIRQKRKTLTIQIDAEGQLLIKAPHAAPEKLIMDFVAQKKRWIQKKIEHAQTKKEKVQQMEIEPDKINALIDRAPQIFLEETDVWVTRMNVEPTQIKITKAKTLWGSCNSRNQIRLNWRLLLVPQQCREYVIIHELAHIKHKDHSKDFWEFVGRFCSDYKNIRAQLHEYSYLLKAF